MEVVPLSHQHQDMQAKSSIIPMTARQIRLKIINRKTKHLRMNNRSDAAITPGGEEINELEHFTYLGQSSFFSIQSTWEHYHQQAITSTPTQKSRCSRTICSVLWCQSVEDDQKHQESFRIWGLRRVQHIFWPNTFLNKELHRRTGTRFMSYELHIWWRWIWHVLHMSLTFLPKVALCLNWDGCGQRGGPKETWRRTVEKEMKQQKWTMGHLEKCAAKS